MTDCHPPFYYLLLHFWLKIFGVTELTSRGFSFFFVVLTAAVLFFIGSQFIRRAGALGALFYLGSPMVMGLGSFARMYTLLHFFTALTTLVMVFILRYPNRKTLFLIYSLLIVLGLLTHYYLFMVLAAQGLALLVTRSPRMLASLFLSQIAGIALFSALWGSAFLYHLSPAIRASDHSEGITFYTPIWTALKLYGGLMSRTPFFRH